MLNVSPLSMPYIYIIYVPPPLKNKICMPGLLSTLFLADIIL